MKKNKKCLKIAMLDLNHMTLGIHTNTVPLGIGLISYYLKKNIDYKFDIKLFKDYKECLQTFKDWIPDIVGMAQYAWNSNLNSYIAKMIKKNNPDCFIIAGGPDLYLSDEQQYEFLQKNSFIDICTAYDGEIPFTDIVKWFISGESVLDIRQNPGAGCYSIDKISGKFCKSLEPLPRLKSLDVFGSIYAEKEFDKFFDAGFHPFLQTQRGCPFKCIYCHASGDYYSNVIFQSSENFKKDMDYLGKRFRGQHNVPLYLANTNFGLFRQDFEIAHIIREIQDKYEWPRNIYADYGKEPDKLLKLFSIWKYKMLPIISLQTLTDKVLKNIGRKNIPYKDFVKFQMQVTKDIGEKTATELILSLPEETKESFLNTLSMVLESGVQNVITYTLMALKGTEIASKEFEEKYGHISKYRLVPRCFSEINGEKIFEVEKVIVGTNSMPFSDYLSLRGLSLIITAFASSVEMFPLRKFLMENLLNITSWILGIQKNIHMFEKIYNVYNDFLEETKGELFDSEDNLGDFYKYEKNYKLLSCGKYGDNLLRKYKAILLSRHYKDCLKLAFMQIKYLLEDKKDMNIPDKVLEELERYLNVRDIGKVFVNGYDYNACREKKFDYDIPAWLKQGKGSLVKDYKKEVSYKISITDSMVSRLNNFNEMNKDPDLSLQILYRDGIIEDFWPIFELS